MTELSIIIVSYNVKSLLEQAVVSIKKALDGISSEIFIVDNNSIDGSVALIRKKFPEVQLITNNHNFGFAKANNQALKKMNGEFVCLINPDTIVQKNTFQLCLEYLKTHNDTGAVGCKILNPNGTLQLACRRSFPTPWVAFTKVSGLSNLFPGSRLFGKYNLTYIDPLKTIEVDAISGSFMLLRKKTIDETGFLDESFFLYGEDLDWCYRIKENGWKIVYLPDTQIIHYKGSSTREAEFDSIIEFYKAMQIFVEKHFKSGWSFLPRWFLIFGIWSRGSISFLTKFFKKITIPLIDILFLQASLLLSIMIKFGDINVWLSYRLINLIYTFVWFLSFVSIGLYLKKNNNSFKAVEGVVAGLIINTSLTFFLPQYAFSRQVMLVAGLLNCIFLSGWRILFYLSAGSPRSGLLINIGKYIFQRRTLIVADSDSAYGIIRKLDNSLDNKYNIVGFITPDDKNLIIPEILNKPVLGTLKDLKHVVSVHNIHDVIFSTSSIDYQIILETIGNAEISNVDFKMIPADFDLIIGNTHIDTLYNIPLVNLDYNFYKTQNILFKRILDFAVTFIFFPFLILLFLYILLSPKYELKKINIFDGMGDKIKVLAVKNNGKLYINGLGKIPLFFEVMRGRISLVGSKIVQFDSCSNVKGYKPGLTGLIQISKTNSEKDIQQLNQFYLKNYSLLLDMEILFKSIFHT